MFKHILSIAIKDFRLFAADRKSMIISFLVPIGIASFFTMVMGGGGGNQKATKIPVLVVNEDNNSLTKSLVDKLSASDAVSVEVVSREFAMESVKKGTKSVAIAFGIGFATQAKSALFAGQPAILEEFYDPSKSIDRQVVQGAIMQVLMQEISRAGMTGQGAKNNLESAMHNEKDPERKKAWGSFVESWDTLDKSGAMTGSNDGGGGGGMRQPFEITAKAVTASKDENAETNATRGHIFAGMAIQGIMFFAIDAAMGLLRDKRTGVWTRMKAAPVSSMSLVLGKGLGAWFIAFLIFAGVLAFGMLVFGFRVYGSWIGLLLVALMSALMTASFGLFVASLGKSEAQSRGLSVLAVLMMSMLGGAWFPSSMMPKAVQTLSAIIPVRWAIDGVDAMMYRGSGLTEGLIPILALALFAIGFTAFAILRLRKA